MNNCDNNQVESVSLNPNRLREECIITPKVYDSCRQQDCLTVNELGPARADSDDSICDAHIMEGTIIVPPKNAATVSIGDVSLGNVMITEKRASQFRNGFWDITIKYSFKYKLTFRESDGSLLGTVPAVNIYTKRVSLFGSNDTCVNITTDLFDNSLSSGPHILVESKAVSLGAEIDYRTRGRGDYSEPIGVNVTIGLFTIIKLYRIVNLKVESRGFCVPDICDDTSPISVCDYFEGLDFPMDIFAPPQRPEFLAGISNNIPNNNSNNNSDCMCSCSRPVNDCGCDRKPNPPFGACCGNM